MSYGPSSTVKGSAQRDLPHAGGYDISPSPTRQWSDQIRERHECNAHNRRVLRPFSQRRHSFQSYPTKRDYRYFKRIGSDIAVEPGHRPARPARHSAPFSIFEIDRAGLLCLGDTADTFVVPYLHLRIPVRAEQKRGAYPGPNKRIPTGRSSFTLVDC